ncbi:MAG: hypothetical protein M3466_15455, partial [Gemmatimonadota bacterium]|nr:hypothetical protein [Gemmatimonadota bacterium]
PGLLEEQFQLVGGRFGFKNRSATAAPRRAIPTHLSMESSIRAPYAQIATPTTATARRTVARTGDEVEGSRDGRKIIVITN